MSPVFYTYIKFSALYMSGKYPENVRKISGKGPENGRKMSGKYIFWAPKGAPREKGTLEPIQDGPATTEEAP